MEEMRRFARDFRERTRADGVKPLIGLCLGASGVKYAHFDYARSLMQASRGTDYRIALILGGDFTKDATERQRHEFQLLGEERDVCLIPRFVAVNEFKLSDCVDFYWRGYRDLSTSYTMYVAASVRKPVLAMNSGFVARAVREYELGAVVDNGFSELEHALSLLEAWSPEKGGVFLDTHSWSIGATRLREAAIGRA